MIRTMAKHFEEAGESMVIGDHFAHFVRITVISLIAACAAGSASRAHADVEAYSGEPFGVARVTVPVFRGEPSLPLNDERFTVLEATDRAFYPVVKTEPARQFLRGLLGIETPRNVTMYFLFRGNEPFDLSVYSPIEQGAHVVPRNDPSGHRRLYDEWWQQTTERWSRLQKDPQFPPMAENFLVALFARRMNREVPEVGAGLLGLQKKHSALEELFGGEAAQLAVHRQLILGSNQPNAQPEPVPPTPNWPALQIDPTGLDEVEIESIAEHVPEECFYIRFGNFVNYFWFRDFNTKWDGDLQNMVARRALRRLATSRVEQQLSLKENALSRILGPQFIIDAALVGGDPYLQQGAAIGILAQARNNQLLSQDFMRQRRMALETFPDATESTVQLAGKDVSLIATPDGRVRSYYAQSGDFHLVTTSRKIAERFLEASEGKGSLAKLRSFLNARKQIHIKRDDTVFVFLSEKFFQNLCSPQIWAESRRRRQSMQEPLVLDLARYAAMCEGLDAATLEQLIEAGLLPRDFGQHIDKSTVTENEAGFLDSLRGAPGYYLPVADVPVESFSPAEVAAYREFIQAFTTEVGQLPPIAVALHRDPTDLDKFRTLTIDFLAAPLGTVKLGTVIDSLGEPVDEQLKPIEGNIGSLEVVLDLPVPLIGGENQPHMLFAGLRDYRSPLAVSQGRLVPGAERSELVRGYIGAWPRPGLLKMLQGADGPPGPQPQAIGETMWQAQSDNFLLISFKPDVIQQVQPQLSFEPAERPAQVRVHINDLTDTQFSETLNAFGYMRARETSVAPARLMNSLANLLQVPRDECLDLSQRLLDATFTCPLDGEYKLFESEGSLPIWSSSALPAQNRNLLTEVPADFHLPMLTWFKGMTGDMQISGGTLSGHAELELTSEALP
jgi:hypothetical protein